jgi:tetratricopeptide (TPR) repeat protein
VLSGRELPPEGSAAGERQQARQFQRLADFDAPLAVQRSQARAVLAADKDDWDEWDCVQAVALLLGAGDAMEDTCPLVETLAVYEGAYKLAMRAELPHDRLLALLGRGRMHRGLGQLSQAAQFLQAAQKLASELGDRLLLTRATYNLGLVRQRQGDPTAARRLLQEALDNARHLHLGGIAATILHSLGTVDFQEGDLTGAREKFRQALAVHRSLGDAYNMGLGLYELGHLDYLSGDLSTAEQRTREALDIALREDDRFNEATRWHQLGMIAVRQGELDKADGFFRRALEAGRDIGETDNDAAALEGLGIVAMRKGNRAAARQVLLRALWTVQRHEDPEREASIWSLLAHLARSVDRPVPTGMMVATGIVLARRVSTAEAAERAQAGYRDLEAYARHQAMDDPATLLEQAERAYHHDQGRSLIESVFGPLDDLEPPSVQAPIQDQ